MAPRKNRARSRDNDWNGERLVNRPIKDIASVATFRDNQEYVFKMGYDITATSTTGALSSLTAVALNSLYDPEAGAGARQPRYFDSLVGTNDGTAPYRYYCVTGCDIDVEVTSNDAKVYQVAMGPYSAASQAPGTMTEARERKGFRWVLVGSDGGVVHLRQHVDMSQITGQDVKRDDDFWGSSGANPATLVSWNLFVQAAAAQTVTLVGTVTFAWRAVLYGLTDPADS